MERLNLTGNKTLANPEGYMAKHAEKMNDTSSSLSILFYPAPPLRSNHGSVTVKGKKKRVLKNYKR